MRRALFGIGMMLCLAAPAAAQDRLSQPDAAATEVLPAISFDVVYLKHLPPRTPYSPYYSWDARLAFDAAVVRRGPWQARFAGSVQSAGTENFGTRIGVGGAGYVLSVLVRRDLSADARVSVGLVHLSTHLTRDLDEKTEDERERGASIPHVEDPPEYNVPTLEWSRRFLQHPLSPQLVVGVVPVNIRLSARSRGWNRRPLYADTRWVFWERGGRAVVLETTHELGAGPLNRFTAAFEIDRPRTSSRLQAFLSYSPGSGLHVSPRLGGVRDGLAAGLRLTVRSGE